MLAVLVIVPARLANGPTTRAQAAAHVARAAPVRIDTSPATMAIAVFCLIGLLATLVAHRLRHQR